MTLEVLREGSYDVRGLRSKSWNEFSVPGAVPMDFVFTVCNQAAGESCPAWLGQPITAHWDFGDPAAVVGDHEARRRAFVNAQHQIATRIRLFLSLPLEKLDRLSLQTQLRELGGQGAERSMTR